MLKELLNELISLFNESVFELTTIKNDKLFWFLWLLVLDVIKYIIQAFNRVFVFLYRIGIQSILTTKKNTLSTSIWSDVIKLSEFISSLPMFSIIFNNLLNILNAFNNLNGCSIDSLVPRNSIFILRSWFIGFRKCPLFLPFFFLFFFSHILVVNIVRISNPSSSKSCSCSRGTSTLFSIINFFLNLSDLLFPFFSKDLFKSRNNSCHLYNFLNESWNVSLKFIMSRIVEDSPINIIRI